MKMKFSVYHGQCNESITVESSGVVGCLAQIRRTNLGIGYAIDFKSPCLTEFINSLATNGEAQRGWADYQIID